MNLLDFFASIYASTVWPATALVIVSLFRHQVKLLLPFVRLKKGDAELWFDRQLAKAAEQLELSATKPLTPSKSSDVERFERVAAESPRDAFLELRAYFEEALRDKAALAGWPNATPRAGFPPDHQATLHELIQSLKEADYLDEHTASTLDEIRRLGNRMAHDDTLEITSYRLQLYREAVDRGIQKIVSLTPPFPSE